jgi:2'-5' RNA ligase
MTDGRVDAGAARAGRHRVFFALWPDDATRSALSRATRDAVGASGGRPIAKSNLHLTVAFLGELTDAGLERARAAPPISVGAFDLALDTLGLWPDTRLLWLASHAVPEPLDRLEELLWDALEARGFEREQRTFRPHMTLARRARAVDGAIAAVPWHVAELALVESFPDGRNVHYEVLEKWPL